ncbi:type II/IV secretion system protein [bacterium]|nr:type II/IV secretion system protein [bacterium]MBT4894739.1 type II/IV secretion system protein [bacterium]
MVTFDETKSNKRVANLRKKEEEDLASILSNKYGLEYIDLSAVSINTDALQLITEETSKEAEMAIFNKIGKKISIAVRSPNNEKAKNVIKELEERGFIPKLFMVSSTSIERAIKRYADVSFAVETKAGMLDISGEEIQNITNGIKNIDDAKKLVDETLSLKKAHRVSRILEVILGGGLSLKASDVHIEPEESAVRLRYRLDGVLVNITEIDLETYKLLLSRIKLISGLKINLKNTAQDGRFSIKINKGDVEIRTSMLPDAYGESIVMRILNPDTISLSMENLGIEKKLFEVLEKEIGKPNGMILTTGPTGSGKTTTLYAFLKRIQTPEKKIITIEDPIEYHLPGIVQTQTDGENYTFGNGLRSTLRQDPDIIMVGEIRDEDVASTAINAALTGHLVFSTLHTNNAAGAFPRLIDLGINPKIISSAVNIVLAQRLVRKLCESCKKQVELSADKKDLINKVLKTIPEKENLPEDVSTVWEATGCDECNNTGYQGRIGIYEAVVMDEEVEALVKSSASEREIANTAVSQGILNMQQDGMLKVLKGVTSLEELERVVEVL